MKEDFNPYPLTVDDIAVELEGKTKQERLLWYENHREEVRQAFVIRREAAQWSEK